MDLRALIAVPMIGALVVLLGPSRGARAIGGAVAAATLLMAALAVRSGAAEATWSWIPALGLRGALGLDGLAAPGVLVICLVGQVATLAPRGGRGAIAGGLALQAVLLALVLARDLAVMALCHALLAPLVAGLVAGGPGPDRWRAGQAAGLYLALGTGALMVAIGLLAVAHHDATDGVWDLSLAALTQVLLPRGLEVAVGGLVLLAGALTLGLWPLHGWMVAAGAAAPTGPALMIAGPVRWVGAYLLLRLWLPLTPGMAAMAAFGVGLVAVIGGVIGGLCARAEADERRALLLATTVPTGVMVLGLVGQHHEGAVGAIVLAVVVALGGAAGLMALAGGVRARWAGLGLLVAPGLAGCVGAALVLIGTARFSGLTLGGSRAGARAGRRGGADRGGAGPGLADMARRTWRGGHGAGDRSHGAGAGGGAGRAAGGDRGVAGAVAGARRRERAGDRRGGDAAALRGGRARGDGADRGPGRAGGCMRTAVAGARAARGGGGDAVTAEEVTLVAPLVIAGLWALLVPLAGRALPDGWTRGVALAGIGLALAAAATLIGAPALAAGGCRCGATRWSPIEWRC
jgi:NADH-quinone oxidoreductase subunit M